MRPLPRVSRWEELMLPLQKCLTMAAPTKWFAPPLEEAQKGWSLCIPWVSWYMSCILPSRVGFHGRGIWALQEADGSGIPGANTCQVGLDRTQQASEAESWWLRCGDKNKPVQYDGLTQKPWSRSPLPVFTWDGMIRMFSLPFIIPLN